VAEHGYFGRASELMAIKVEIPRIRPYLGAPDRIVPFLMGYRGDHKENKVDEHCTQIMLAVKLRRNRRQISQLTVHIHEKATKSFTDTQEFPFIRWAKKMPSH
jgi:hypothetical protein